METNQPRPKNYLVESILVTIFCCLPLGIVGIINASKVNSAYDQGNFEEANKASADAKKWTKIGFIIGIVATVLYLIFVFAMGGLAILGGGSY
ncbi:CD225/dispanin family protein [Aquimarina sp. BL5]|uniref:CD225/dispanin family protein n=1 Tax=Aquimarina sp. BL5 TaxID=1714860 RepID=UPI000E4CC1ED|nr:CD225/dispanin family protein [Aquimarina sp. BL5]AXT53763.1 CD225/dispanin family protein [Aquimarina sp. BL5]RKN03434.1 CD225/dispanin family protein [Aquimarina sp. BL5]